MTTKEQINLLKELEKNKESKNIAKSSLSKMANKNLKFFSEHLNYESDVIKTIKENFNMIAKKDKEEVIVKNYTKAKQVLMQEDIREIFEIDLNLKVCYENDLFNFKNKTYFAKFKDGYRLVVSTRGYKLEGEWVNFHPTLTIINLYILIYHCTYKTAIQNLMQIFNIKLKGKMEKLENLEKTKYAENILMIRKEINKYENLNKFIGGYLYILEHLNYVSLETTTNEHRQYKNNNIFYATVRTIEDDIKQLERDLGIIVKAKSKSSISKALTLFRAFGLIAEVEFDVAKDYFDVRKAEASHYQKKFYMTVALNKKVLTKADKLAGKLLKNGVTIRNFEYEEVKEVDEKLAEKVFMNTVKTNINKENAGKFKEILNEDFEDEVTDEELEELEDLF